MPQAPSCVGVRQGTFEVDANGQATYRLPIEVPPGIAGSQPEIALVYSHHQANGVLGMGWGLSGLSAITRTKATLAVDGFNGGVDYGADDRFLLDGKRLINVDGQYGHPNTVYYTELHEWTQVVAGTTPQEGFRVYLKSGETREYGTTPDSLILAADGAADVRVWALAAIEDLNGNRVEYAYTQTPFAGIQSSGAYYVSQIRYTVRKGTPSTPANRFVDFGYGSVTRPDVLCTYLAGYPITTSCLLQSISVSLAGNVPVRTYSLSYRTSSATEISCLAAIAVTGADGVELPPIRIDWQDVPSPSLDTSQVASPLLAASTVIQTLAMEVDGDGMTDVVQLYVGENGRIHAVPFLAELSQGEVSYSQAEDCALGFYGEQGQYQIMAADVNGDGIDELVVAYEDDDGLFAIDVFMSNGTGFSGPSTTSTATSWQGSGAVGLFAVDADGDGRTDLVLAYPNGDGLLVFKAFLSEFVGCAGAFSTATPRTVTHSPAPSATGSIWAIDVNGDGMVDMVLLWLDSQGLLNTTSFVSHGRATGLSLFAEEVSSCLGVSSESQVAILPADANGDGFVDIIQISQSSTSPLAIQSFLSDATGGFVCGPAATFSDQTIPAANLYPMGFNGGSQTCLLTCWLDANNDLNFTVFGSSPSGSFRHLADVDTMQGLSSLNFMIGDANGDGKADLLLTYADVDGTVWLQPLLSAGEYPDLVSRIAEPLGGCVDIAYSSLANPAVYAQSPLKYPKTTPRRYPSHLSPAQFPQQEVLGRAIQVVALYALSNNAAVNRYSYLHNYLMRYADARIDLLGRGWEGFGSVSKLDLQTGLRTVHCYVQGFPYTGAVACTRVEADAGISTDPKVARAGQPEVLLGLSLNTYQSLQPVANAPSFAVQRVGALVYEYDYGQPDYVIANSFAYDGYGNVSVAVWYGYVVWIDPAKVSATAPLPEVVPLAQDEVVYTYREFQNEVSGTGQGWALGYLLFEKLTTNAVDTDVEVFQPGDYQLTACTYDPSTCNLQTQAHWDDVNACFLTTGFTYDLCGNRASETRPGGSTTLVEHDPTYHTYPAVITSPPNEQGTPLKTYHGYDPRFGVQVAFQDENGFVHVVGLDGFGRKICEQGPVPESCDVQDANVLSPLVTGTQPFSLAKVLTLETQAYLSDGSSGLYVEHSALQTFPVGNARDDQWARRYVDGLGRVCLSAVQSGRQAGPVAVTSVYDPCGKVAQHSLPFFASDLTDAAPHVVVHRYDVLGRLIQTVCPSGADGSGSVTHARDYAAGQQMTVTQAVGAAEQFVQVVASHLYRGDTRRIRCVTPADDQATIVFAFDALGRLCRVTDPAGVVNTIAYDALSRKTSYDNPDQNATGKGKAFGYLYDAATGRLASITDASGSVTNYAHDELGRVCQQSCSDQRQFKFCYDSASNGLGKLASVAITSADGSTESLREFAYDCYGNATQEALTIAHRTFVTASAYDPRRRLVMETYPDSTVLTRHYQFGVLVHQDLAGATIDYPLAAATPLGSPGQVDCGDGLSFARQYNPYDLWYGETAQDGGGTKLLDVNRTYDLLDQLLSSADSVSQRTELFVYQNRRLQAARVNGFPEGSGTYAYDGAGNFSSKDGNQYLDYRGHFPQTIRKGTDVIYTAQQDDCGRTRRCWRAPGTDWRRRAHKGVTLTFDYDGLGQLSGVSRGTTSLRMMCSDDRGRRIKEQFEDGSVTFYVSPAYRETVNASGVVTTKVLIDSLGPAASVETVRGVSTVSYFRRDHKGNVTHVFDDQGKQQATIAYDGYGLPLNLTGRATALYEGRPWDAELGLYAFGARDYDPATGLFLTPDSRLGARSALRADAWNRFAFELNSPVNHVDPTGHWTLAAQIGIFAGVTALSLVGIGLTIVTGGVSDAAVAALDSSAAAAGADTEMTAVAEVGAEGGASAAADAGEATAARGASLLSKTVVRMGIGAVGGGLGSAASGAGFAGMAYMTDGSGNASGLEHALQMGAVSGSISGAIGGLLNPALSALEAMPLKMVGGALIGAGANVAGLEASYHAIDHQAPDPRQIAASTVAGLLSGAASAGFAHLKGSGGIASRYQTQAWQTRTGKAGYFIAFGMREMKKSKLQLGGFVVSSLMLGLGLWTGLEYTKGRR